MRNPIFSNTKNLFLALKCAAVPFVLCNTKEETMLLLRVGIARFLWRHRIIYRKSTTTGRKTFVVAHSKHHPQRATCAQIVEWMQKYDTRMTQTKRVTVTNIINARSQDKKKMDFLNIYKL